MRRNLEPLPENSRYFQYKGLPCVLFWGAHHWGWNRHPDAGQIHASAGYCNFVTLQASHYRGSNYVSFWERISRPEYWVEIGESIRFASEADLLVHLYFYDGNYSLETAKYRDSGEFMNVEFLDADLKEFGLPGITNRKIHEKVIDMAVEHIWDFPNVLFDPAFEIINAFRRGTTTDGFIKWWVEEFKARGAARNPEVHHLFGTMRGGEGARLERRSMDLIIGEHNRDDMPFEPERIKPEVMQFGCPLIRMALLAPEPYHNEVIGLGHPAHDLMIRQILHGIHTAEDYNLREAGNRWGRQSPELDEWFLQTRWYLENIRTWENEPGIQGGDEIVRDKLPQYASTRRPVLEEAEGFRGGLRLTGGRIEFGCVYRHPDGLFPIQAEVWADLNGDGRYAPGKGAGERIRMIGEGDDPRAGVRYTATIETPAGGLNYVFRFADKHWKPPVPGGVIPGRTDGISYESHSFPLQVQA